MIDELDMRREVGRRKGTPWQQIPRDQRLGDLLETIYNLEPRRSDPFPRSAVSRILELFNAGFGYEDIDRLLRGDIHRGRVPSWQMYLSD